MIYSSVGFDLLTVKRHQAAGCAVRGEAGGSHVSTLKLARGCVRWFRRGLCVVDSASHYSLSCLLPQAEWFLGVEVLCSLGGNLIILLSKVKILPHTLLTEG